MQLALGEEARRLIEMKVKSGRYDSAEAVVLAGLQSLMQQPEDELEDGELEALLAEAEQSIAEEGTVDADQVFRRLEERSAKRRGGG